MIGLIGAETIGLGAISGLIAAAVMNWPMSHRADGFTPAYVAAGILTGRSADTVPFRDAVIAHHAAGLLAGILYAVVATVIGIGVPSVASVTVAGVDILAHLLASTLVVIFIYVFFAHLVLPRAGGRIYEEQSTAVRGQWLRSSLVFGTTIVVVVPLLAVVVAS
ncbi:hypothetical protein HUB97_13090 [Halorubraceae archaeon YAN]|nr:hypothetical protein [Halorubraceae archaeon YAN]